MSSSVFDPIQYVKAWNKQRHSYNNLYCQGGYLFRNCIYCNIEFPCIYCTSIDDDIFHKGRRDFPNIRSIYVSFVGSSKCVRMGIVDLFNTFAIKPYFYYPINNSPTHNCVRCNKRRKLLILNLSLFGKHVAFRNRTIATMYSGIFMKKSDLMKYYYSIGHLDHNVKFIDRCPPGESIPLGYYLSGTNREYSGINSTDSLYDLILELQDKADEKYAKSWDENWHHRTTFYLEWKHREFEDFPDEPGDVGGSILSKLKRLLGFK